MSDPKYIPNAAEHAIIGDVCRATKGDEQAMEEALDRIRQKWRKMAPRWPGDECHRFHVVLIVERATQH